MHQQSCRLRGACPPMSYQHISTLFHGNEGKTNTPRQDVYMILCADKLWNYEWLSMAPRTKIKLLETWSTTNHHDISWTIMTYLEISSTRYNPIKSPLNLHQITIKPPLNHQFFAFLQWTWVHLETDPVQGHEASNSEDLARQTGRSTGQRCFINTWNIQYGVFLYG